jgi:hypothetical protein
MLFLQASPSRNQTLLNDLGIRRTPLNHLLFSAIDAGTEDLPAAACNLFFPRHASWVAGVVRCRQIVLSPPFGEQVAPRSFWHLVVALGSARWVAPTGRVSRQLRSPRDSNRQTLREYMRIVYLASILMLPVVLFCRLDVAAAQGSDAARQACTPDAMRLCSDVIPDVARVTACMKAKSSQLSEACRVAMRGEPSGKRRHAHYHHHYHRHR